MRIFFSIFIFLTLCLSCQHIPQMSRNWPTEKWPLSSPEKQEMDKSLLSALDQKIADGDYGLVDHMLIIRRGHVVYDKAYVNDYQQISAGYDTSYHMYNYYHPDWHPFYKGTKLHTVQSVTKSITSAVIGIALSRNELPDINIKIIDYFENYDIQNMDDLKQRITLEDLLTMRAGFDWDESTYPYTDPRNNCAQMEKSTDWVAYVLNRPMAHEPGTVFEYNSGASQLLSFLIKKATGLYIDEYAEQFLFTPLGIKEYYWKRTPTQLPDTEGGLYLTAHDLAKIGYLYLQKGLWDGQQLIPEKWIESSLQLHVRDTDPEDDDWNAGYGYQWWLLPIADSYTYTMLGYGGQRLIAVPERDLMAVFTGWNIYETESLPLSVFYDFIYKAVKDTAEQEGP